jgi:molecular chaperone GrpE
MSEKKEKDKLVEELKASEKKAAEYLAGWQRAKADFINHKKDELKRIEDFLKSMEEGFILKILPILDNFEMAFQQKQEWEKEAEDKFKAIVEGFLQIKKQLEDLLKSCEVEEIESIGKMFDPNLHEAVEKIDSEKETGTIVQEVQKGYKINGRLLRPAKVKVSK